MRSRTAAHRRHAAYHITFRRPAAVLLLVGMLLGTAGGAGSARGDVSHVSVLSAPVELTGDASVPLHEPVNLATPGQSGSAESRTAAGSPTAGAHERDPVDMKVLLITADRQETDFPALKAWLDQIGIPYDTLVATETTLTPGFLWDGVSHGYYQAVVLTTGNLTYFNPDVGEWQSAFTDSEWATLWAYQAEFGIRQLTSYTYPAGPPDDYGLNLVTYQDTTHAPLQATLTSEGRSVFPYLNAATPVTFRYAWVYLATIRDPANTAPLLETSDGYAIASINRYPDGRENLAVTAANNPHLLHSELLSYGIINWVTKGLFLGERHVNMGAQVDDLLIDSNIWDPVANSDETGLTYRLSGADYNATTAWQQQVRGRNENFGAITLEMAYNGEGASGIYTPDTLTPTVRANSAPFNWVNHTYTHENLDNVDYATATRELRRNHAAANTLGLLAYFRDALVQPDISGLGNPAFLLAAHDFGIKHLIADTSRAGWNNPSPNAGFYSQFQPTILIIPRRPTNLFYNLSTPEEFVDEYNFYYGPGGRWEYWPRDQTFAEIIDHESDNLLSYMLHWDLDPWMFHQANLRMYDGTRSLLGDLVDATLEKYEAVYRLPIRNLSQHSVGIHMARRMAYNASGVHAVLRPCDSITITTSTAARIPVTGVSAGANWEVYGGQSISYLLVDPVGGRTVRLPAC